MKLGELERIIKSLERYNAWRRGDEDVEQPNPEKAGEDIDAAIGVLKANAEMNNEQ